MKRMLPWLLYLLMVILPSSVWATEGDLDNVDNITLRDAVIALQITSGVDPGILVHASADVNGDQKIGTVEAIYILQTLSGLRPDRIAPSIPIDFKAAAVSWNQIDLTWTASEDNVGVTGYQIHRNATVLGNASTPFYSDIGLTSSTQYCYTIFAYDAAGNFRD